MALEPKLDLGILIGEGRGNIAQSELAHTMRITTIIAGKIHPKCTEWHKKRELLKNPTKIEEIQEKKLLTEMEPLQLVF